MGALARLLLVAAVSAGCALPGRKEKAAFEALARMEARTYGTSTAASTRRLPRLQEEAELRDYLVYAALNNPGLEAAFNRWKAALMKVPQARSLPDPRFTFAYFIREVETRVGPQRAKLGLAQLFPWFGKLRLQGEAALAAAEAARQEYEARKLALFYEVKSAYWELAYLKRALDITRDMVALLQYLEEVARTRYMAGIAPHSDVIKAQVELGKLEDRLRTLADLRRPLVARLNAALNRPPDAPVPWPAMPPLAPVTFREEDLAALVRARNPQVLAWVARAEAARKRLERARREYFPDLTVGVDYVLTGEARNRATPESGKDPVVAAVGLNLPIWIGRRRAQVAEEEARRVLALRERADLENALLSRLKMALFGFRDAERKIDLYRDTLIPKAEETLGALQENYAAGRASFLDLIDAERVLLDFRLGLERARADRAIRLAELELLTGGTMVEKARKEAP